MMGHYVDNVLENRLLFEWLWILKRCGYVLPYANDEYPISLLANAIIVRVENLVVKVYAAPRQKLLNRGECIASF